MEFLSFILYTYLVAILMVACMDIHHTFGATYLDGFNQLRQRKNCLINYWGILMYTTTVAVLIVITGSDMNGWMGR